MEWHYVQGGQSVGPVSEDELDRLVQSGTLTPETLVWRDGQGDWQPYRTARSAGASAGGQGGVVCAECGKVYSMDQVLQFDNKYVCASCKPVYVQKIQQGVAMPGEMRYAGFWIRVAATLIDGLIIGIPMMAIFFLILFPMIMKGASGGGQPQNEMAFVMIQVLLNVVSTVITAAYQIFFIGKYGATPGKMAVKIKVVRTDGSKVGYGLATGRFFATWLSYLICYIGVIMVGFDQEKRALHDRICGTRVVHR